MSREHQRFRLGPLAAITAAIAVIVALVGSNAAVAKDSGPERIIGGNATTIEEWPWQTAVAFNPDISGGNGFDRQFCGGTLVAPNVVLSAAHCFHDIVDDDDDFDDPANFSMITGRTTLSSNQGQEIDVADIVVPVASSVGPFFESARNPTPSGPDLYNPDTSEWDAVFVELASNSTSTPIKIAGADETALWEAGKTAWVTGWGNRSQTPPPDFPDDLHEVQIHMISDGFCSSPTSYGSGFISETMVCAGEESGGKDTCQGDSGGPLVVPLDGAGDFRLVGDTSFGIGCALPNFPGVYGRVADDPMRSAFACGIQREAGANVLGEGAFPSCPVPSGPAPPGTGTGSPTPDSVTPAPPPPADERSCQDARDDLRKAKKSLKRAKAKLKQAKQKDASDEKIDKAKKKVKKAKKRVKRAKQRVEEVC